jgi:imidazole glycerol phosphate synthase subunit HisF
MGVPNTINQCINCGEPVVWYGNAGAWKHYPEHVLNAAATACMAPHVLAKDKVTVGLASTLKTAVNRS